MAYFTIVTSPFQSQVSDLLPCNNNAKSVLIYTMLKSYGLLEHFNEVIDLPGCTVSDIRQFHSSEYLKVLLNSQLDEEEVHESSSIQDQEWMNMASTASNWEDEAHNNHSTFSAPWFPSKRELKKYYSDNASFKEEASSFKQERWKIILDPEHHDSDKGLEEEKQSLCAEILGKFGLSHDCHIFQYLPTYCYVTTGATLALARPAVSRQKRTISINWDGGRHHALKSKASGFCFVNDIVLLIQKLRRRGITSVSYVDLDLHHGDGVERAFQYSANVQTISVHLLEPGFFPGSGSVKESQNGHKIVNLPVLHGFSDNDLAKLVDQVILPCIEHQNPQVIVIQCGADGLMGDKYGEWQLTIKGLSESICAIIRRFPQANVVLLGGGGYNINLTSRFYTYLSWKLLAEFSGNQYPNPFKEDEDTIPDHEFIDFYKDEFYKFWYYDAEGCQTNFLKNDNNAKALNKLVQFYDPTRTSSRYSPSNQR
ncbi:LADA_0C02960g1_1 [Lachancea dasiensis]|uniref:histone deacetylase n=1 Tax=Lachancea dasiensis TaxID=1072105 RepID=A0A1G4IYD9_9SACH|nr:LADA_0C02960g1_1 [Lachancea dasiensis]